MEGLSKREREIARLLVAGYSGVSSLYRDNAGTWHALAYKGPADVEVALDLSGHIT